MHEVANGQIARNIQIGSRDHRRHRDECASQCLAQHRHVRTDAGLLRGEEAPGSTEPAWYLVEHEQNAMSVAEHADLGPVSGRRQSRAGEHRAASTWATASTLAAADRSN